MQNIRWKVLTILVVFVVFAGVGVYPILAARYHWPSPSWLQEKQIKLGLDLRGGVNLEMRVETDDALQARDRSGKRAVARRADEARCDVHEHHHAERDAVPRRGRAAGLGRRVPSGRERSADELRSECRRERHLYVHDEAEASRRPFAMNRSSRRARRSNAASTNSASPSRASRSRAPISCSCSSRA